MKYNQKLQNCKAIQKPQFKYKIMASNWIKQALRNRIQNRQKIKKLKDNKETVLKTYVCSPNQKKKGNQKLQEIKTVCKDCFPNITGTKMWHSFQQLVSIQMGRIHLEVDSRQRDLPLEFKRIGYKLSKLIFSLLNNIGIAVSTFYISCQL